MADVLLTVSTGKSLKSAPLRVDLLAIDQDTDQVVLNVVLTAEQWWDLCTGKATIVRNDTRPVPLTDARIKRLRELCADEDLLNVGGSYLARRVLAILDDKGWGKT